MKKTKEMIGVIMAFVIAISLSSCIDSNYILRDIRSGVFTSNYKEIIEDMLVSNEKIKERYGENITIEYMGGGEDGDIDLKGRTDYVKAKFLINKLHEYEFTACRINSGEWEVQGGISTMSFYKCDEIDCKILWNSYDRAGGYLKLNGKKIEIYPHIFNGGEFSCEKLKEGAVDESNMENFEEIFGGEFQGDIDVFTVKLNKSSMKRLSKYNLNSSKLTFREVKSATGEEEAKTHIVNDAKIIDKYKDIKDINLVFCEYKTVYREDSFFEQKIWKCKINNKDTYKIYSCRYDNGNWNIKGILKENTNYISDDEKVCLINKEESEYYKVVAQLGKKYSDMHAVFYNDEIIELDRLELYFKHTSDRGIATFDITRMDVDEFDAVLTEESKKEYGQYFNKLHFHEIN